MVAAMEKVCTVTSKGQTTLPLAVRQALGVPYGGRIAVRVLDGNVTIEPVVEEHDDPAIRGFLSLLENDIMKNGNIGHLPDDLLATLHEVFGDAEIDLDEPIEGDVCL